MVYFGDKYVFVVVSLFGIWSPLVGKKGLIHLFVCPLVYGTCSFLCRFIFLPLGALGWPHLLIVALPELFILTFECHRVSGIYARMSCFEHLRMKCLKNCRRQ